MVMHTLLPGRVCFAMSIWADLQYQGRETLENNRLVTGWKTVRLDLVDGAYVPVGKESVTSRMPERSLLSFCDRITDDLYGLVEELWTSQKHDTYHRHVTVTYADVSMSDEGLVQRHFYVANVEVAALLITEA